MNQNTNSTSASRSLYIVDYCLSPQERIAHAGILCEGENILAVGGASAFEKDEGLEIIELPGCYAVPGFVDTHIHGAGGFDSSTGDRDGISIELMCKTLASHGITSFIPTIVSGTTERMTQALNSLASEIGRAHDGAEPIGIHVEGPFINKQKHGSQDEEDIRKVDIGEAKELLAAANGKIRIMTFAPELPNVTELIELLLENNIIPSMGHSIADETDVLKAIDAGASRVTHVFNGMAPLHQRAVGLTTLALTDDRLHIEIILDGSHLHPRMIDLACRTKPKNKIIGISDAIQGAGLRDGNYHLGKTEISVKNGRATTADGTLAGTTLTMERGWRHLIRFSNLARTDAAACLTLNPALSIGFEDRGELHPGKRADIAFFDTRSNNACLTVCSGNIVYDTRGT